MNLSTASPSRYTSGLGQTFGWLKFRGAKPSASWPIIEVLRVVMAALAEHEGRHRNEEISGCSGEWRLTRISQPLWKCCIES